MAPLGSEEELRRRQELERRAWLQDVAEGKIVSSLEPNPYLQGLYREECKRELERMTWDHS